MLKKILYLFLDHKLITYIEMLNIIIYTSHIWISYMMYNTISAHTIFLPMLITSATSAIIFLYRAVYRFRALPAKNSDQKNRLSTLQIVFIRFSNYSNQLTQIMFSGNMLIPIIGSTLGYETAGVIKFFHDGLYTVNKITQKVFGTATQVLYTHMRAFNSLTKQKTLSKTIKTIHQIMIPISILVGFAVVVHTKHHPLYTASVVTLYGALICSENFLTPYESLFIVKKISHYFALLHIASFAIAWLLGIYWFDQSTQTLLAMLLFLRIIIFFICSYMTNQLWKFKTTQTILSGKK